jgi:hypothetical protein
MSYALGSDIDGVALAVEMNVILENRHSGIWGAHW